MIGSPYGSSYFHQIKLWNNNDYKKYKTYGTLQNTLGGVGIGILLALFLSGELAFKKWGTKTIKDNNENKKI
jgi:hypothetical protein